MNAESSFHRTGWGRCLVLLLALALSPLRAAEDQRLAQIEQQLHALQQNKNLLEDHLQLADSGNYFFISGGEQGGGILWPIKQQDYIERLRQQTSSGQLSSEMAERKLEYMHEVVAQYRLTLAEQLRQTEGEMEQLRTEVRELDRASADPDPTVEGGGQSGASAEDIARWRASLACLEEGVRLYPNHWQDCNGSWTMGSRDVAIAQLRSLLRDAGAGTGNDEVNPPAAGQSKIVVISATYGGNCGSALGVTQQLADACEGKQRCDYLVDHQVLTDPAYGCRKDYVYRWQCVGAETYPPIQEQTVAPEASGQYASLWCQ